MAKFAMTIDGWQSAAVAGTYETVLALKGAAAVRGKLKSIKVGGAGEAAQDVQMSLRIGRADQTGDGTSTPLVPTKKHPGSAASGMTGGHTFTVEPTTKEATHLLQMGYNSRAGLALQWPEGEEPVWGGGTTTLYVAIAPGAAVAVKSDVTIEWEE